MAYTITSKQQRNLIMLLIKLGVLENLRQDIHRKIGGWRITFNERSDFGDL